MTRHAGEYPGSKVVIAVMTPRTVLAKSIRFIEEWMVRDGGGNTVLWPPVWADHSGRVDVAFSVGFETAKLMEADWYFRFDEDCGFPIILTDCPIHKRQDYCLKKPATIGEVIAACNDCKARGWDVVLGITLDETGNPITQIQDSQVEAVSETEPFTVDGGGHGFCAVSGKVLRELSVLDSVVGQGGVAINLWTEQNARETEDAVFNRRAREGGFMVCQDPRINWGHRRTFYLNRAHGALDKWRAALLARPKMNEIVEGIYIGDDSDCQTKPAMGHLCVLENPCGNGDHIPIFDGKQAVVAKLNEAADWIEAHPRALVHCGAGIERSPLTVTWWLHKKRGMTLEEAWATVSAKRPQAQDRRAAWLPSDAL